MTLLADSGSTKTTWADAASGATTVTEGLNPLFSTDSQYATAAKQVCEALNISGAQAPSIYFYGAGCGNDAQRERVGRLLREAFRTEDVSVATDLLGACRSVAGDDAMLVGILGTGSNACHYDGTAIASSSVSLGYILGDEGSANHLGRTLLTHYLRGTMPQHLKVLFHERYPYTYDEWIERLYRRPNANRFLATLARFAVDNSGEEYCAESIRHSLVQWHSSQLQSLSDATGCHRISIVGSYAKAIEPTLRKVLASRGLTTHAVAADPMEGLVAYHRKKQKNHNLQR